MKSFNCPDCNIPEYGGDNDLCLLCIRTQKPVPTVVAPPMNTIPDVCKRCSNHPTNGGTGICNCTLPDLNKITC